jgi:hypothetical protein
LGLDCGIAFSFSIFVFCFFSSSFIFSIRFSFFDINQTDRLLDQLILFVTANSIQFLQIATSARRVTSALREDALLPNINPSPPLLLYPSPNIESPALLFITYGRLSSISNTTLHIHLQRDCGLIQFQFQLHLEK